MTIYFPAARYSCMMCTSSFSSKIITFRYIEIIFSHIFLIFITNARSFIENIIYHYLVGYISGSNTYAKKSKWGCVKKMELYSAKIFISWYVKESKWSATLLILNRLWPISIDAIKPKSSIKTIAISRGSTEAITWFLQSLKISLTLVILFLQYFWYDIF